MLTFRATSRGQQNRFVRLFVEGPQPERLAIGTPERAEMAQVRAQQVERPVTVGDHDDRRIGQPDAQIGITLRDPLA